MIDTKQRDHFNSENNRYLKKHILKPPQHTQEEVGLIISELQKRKISYVVEFGSGNGRLTIPLLKSNIQVHAVDISTESLHALIETATYLHIPKQMLSTSQTLPQMQTSAIVGCDILHHVDLDIYLKKMKGILKEKGVILFSEPNILNIAWIVLITFMIDWRIEWRILFCNYFTLTQKLKKYNFTHISIQGHGFFPPPLLNRFPILQKVNYTLGNLPILKLFAYRYIIRATNG